MSSTVQDSPTPDLRDRRGNRTRTPFGDEDIQVVFTGLGGHDFFQRVMSSNRRTAFIYDDRMLLHSNIWFPEHLECSERLTFTFDKCSSYGLLSRCLSLAAEPVSNDSLTYCHDQAYIDQVTKTETMSEEEHKSYTSTFDSAYFNKHTYLAAKLAVGSIIQAVESVHRRDFRNAFCLIRPPGHHALISEACGFCVFNNVAVAAKYAVEKLNYNRVLIVDWDIHHGNSTQTAFYDHPKVLYISIHRYDNQTFWPGLRESNYDFIGADRGFGYNVNVALNDTNINDADYLAIFHRLILPIAYEYDPELILISAGYDSAFGCPIGGLKLSPAVYAHLTRKLMCLADGKVVVGLEGGYCLNSLSESVCHTISALLGDPMPSLESLSPINPSVIESINNCVSVLRCRWKSLHIYPVDEVLPIINLNKLELQSWEDVKVPTFEPTDNDHTEDAKAEIDKHLTYLKQLHPVAKNTNITRTCVVYDSRMENHKNEEDRDHPETPLRIRRAYELLEEYGLARRCKRVEARYATRTELLRVHTEEYLNRLAATPTMEQTVLNELADVEDSVFFNRHTYECATLACGSVLATIDEVCTGGSLSGFALVRPPGHHALSDRSMGFCFFNHVAVGARHAQAVYGLQRVAIIDWDVHHGNGTSKIFENDPNVLYVSVHRFDGGHFYPNTDEAHYNFCGAAEALGRTVNVSWNGRHAKDGDYISLFNHLVIPMIYEFRPNLILVSAGYDALRGDQLGGISVSPECFGHLTSMLMTVAYLVPCTNSSISDDSSTSSRPQTRQSLQRERAKSYTGGLILVLEGGYNISATSEAVCHSISSLLGDSCSRLATGLHSGDKGSKSLHRTLKVQSKYWNQLEGYDPLSCHYDHDVAQNLTNASTTQCTPHSRLIQNRRMESNDLNVHDANLSPVQINATTNQIPYSLVATQQQSVQFTTSASVTPTNHPNSQTNLTVHNTTQPVMSDSVEHNLSTNQIPTSSEISVPQLVDEFFNMRVHTGQSDGSSSASEIEPVSGYTQSSDQATASSTNIRILAESSQPNNPLINGHTSTSSTTLQQLLNLTNLGTEDIHTLLGLDSSHEIPSQLFAVTPLSWCPHLTSVQSNPNWQPNVNSLCSRCPNLRENWVCLSCYSIYCGRYANSHMIEHFTSLRHPVVLSFADLSVWCYECESYVHNEILLAAKSAVHRAKFGIDLPGS